MRAIVAAVALGLAAGSAGACNDPGTPCELPGGFYHLAAPEGAALGLMVFLHGWGGRADAQIAQAGLVEPLRARGWAVAAPQGMPRREGDSGGAWNSRALVPGRDDVAFLRDVIADARRRFGLDAGPVVVGGFSGGGMMTWRLACDAPDSADAYAPVAGLLWRPLPDRCAGPVRMLHTHGWTDAVVPIEGRGVADGTVVQGDLFAGLDMMRATNACAGDAPAGFDAAGPFLRRFWSGCAPGSALALALHRGGHVTPAEWAEMTLDWFEDIAGAP